MIEDHLERTVGHWERESYSRNSTIGAFDDEGILEPKDDKGGFVVNAFEACPWLGIVLEVRGRPVGSWRHVRHGKRGRRGK